MDTVNTLKNKNVIKLRSKKLRSKKLRIQKTKKFATLCIILLSLLIIGTSIKNMYVYFRCSDFIYSLDYYFTHWKDKDLRLIEVDSFSVLSKTMLRGFPTLTLISCNLFKLLLSFKQEFILSGNTANISFKVPPLLSI